MKPEIAEGVVSNTVSGVARHELFVVSSGVGLAWTGFSHVLSPPPLKGSDKVPVSLTGSSPAYPVARQSPFTPPLNPIAGQNGARSPSFKKITPLVHAVRRTTMPEAGLAPFNPTPTSDFRLTYDAVRGSAFAPLPPLLRSLSAEHSEKQPPQNQGVGVKPTPKGKETLEDKLKLGAPDISKSSDGAHIASVDTAGGTVLKPNPIPTCTPPPVVASYHKENKDRV